MGDVLPYSLYDYSHKLDDHYYFHDWKTQTYFEEQPVWLVFWRSVYEEYTALSKKNKFTEICDLARTSAGGVLQGKKYFLADKKTEEDVNTEDQSTVRCICQRKE